MSILPPLLCLLGRHRGVWQNWRSEATWRREPLKVRTRTCDLCGRFELRQEEPHA